METVFTIIYITSQLNYLSLKYARQSTICIRIPLSVLYTYIRVLADQVDILYLQEQWLLKEQFDLLGHVEMDMFFTAVSPMRSNLMGQERPYGASSDDYEELGYLDGLVNSPEFDSKIIIGDFNGDPRSYSNCILECLRENQVLPLEESGTKDIPPGEYDICKHTLISQQKNTLLSHNSRCKTTMLNSI